MRDTLFHLPNEEGLLNTRLRKMFISAIHDGYIKPGDIIPSTRILSKSLKISRNTIVFAVQQLVDEGYFIAKNRSGYYVNPNLPNVEQSSQHSHHSHMIDNEIVPKTKEWQLAIGKNLEKFQGVYRPAKWYEYKYSFVFGQVNYNDFPIHHWRECTKLAAMRINMTSFTTDSYGKDDSKLLEMICMRLLPKRGIKANVNQVLITIGAQNALYMIAQLFGGSGKNIMIENPCYSEARHAMLSTDSNVTYIDVDHHGMVVDDRLHNADLVFVTPSNHAPTNYTMSIERRHQLIQKANQHNFVIIEDDYEFKDHYNYEQEKALKFLDESGRVLYVGSLSKTLFPGIRIGYIVADSFLINKLRIIRSLMMRHPPLNNQYALSLFLSLGYYDQWLRKYGRILNERLQLMEQALEKYPIGDYQPSAYGGASVWINLDPRINALLLRDKLYEQQVVIEAGTHFFANSDDGLQKIRLGYGYINKAFVMEGIEIIYTTIQKMLKKQA